MTREPLKASRYFSRLFLSWGDLRPPHDKNNVEKSMGEKFVFVFVSGLLALFCFKDQFCQALIGEEFCVCVCVCAWVAGLVLF